ncbi:biotin-dependent carboxyltransferase family protein [Neobacillus notoginsengisoli]|uniref:Biotin-dependent carboxyltransferase family protein n=1 Tax=Neobacillus notoginsengisoli TaxID=1578198 RepID=A0A417YRT2_9BACI|nr:biotin-dependent carboxyltransferase family protein [Neobacillus notoginsengisoli]RHW37987.1 biotin-dependent carboxyltransferase family protein [Neobacillus notoginsengisoli]
MITVLKPGLLTSVQDMGRYRYQKYGVIASGVMDQIAHRVANILVGNGENEPTLEITLLGPVLRFEKDCLISICGGNLSPSINLLPVRSWRTIFVRKGSELRFGPAVAGSRAYLAVAGGITVQEVMNSKSTYLRAEIGGYEGRALKPGDVIRLDKPGDLSTVMMENLEGQPGDKPYAEMDWSITSKLIPIHRKDMPIRVMKGKQYHLFDEESKRRIFSDRFEVSPQSDRMGYRLKGPLLRLEVPEELISEAVSFGSIQVPGEGNPIILLADRQTTGGYPKIGQIASVDLPLIAQAKPGDYITFKYVTHEEAQLLFLEREENLKQLKKGIRLKFI